jgi:alkylation response protein AidB-like acyl-CoA dehydrogenase
MQFGLTESQEFLKNSARKFFAGECPSAEMRRLMETDAAYDAVLWSKLTDQGYTGIIYPEAYGGVGLGKVELMLLMEEAGRALLPGPFFSTVVLAGSVLDAVGTRKNISSPSAKEKYGRPLPFWKPARAGTRGMFNSVQPTGSSLAKSSLSRMPLSPTSLSWLHATACSLWTPRLAA